MQWSDFNREVFHIAAVKAAQAKGRFDFGWACRNWEVPYGGHLFRVSFQTIFADYVSQERFFCSKKIHTSQGSFWDSPSETIQTLVAHVQRGLRPFLKNWCNHSGRGLLFSTSNPLEHIPLSFEKGSDFLWDPWAFGLFEGPKRGAEGRQVSTFGVHEQLVGFPRHADGEEISAVFEAVEDFFYGRNGLTGLDGLILQLSIVNYQAFFFAINIAGPLYGLWKSVIRSFSRKTSSFSRKPSL